MRHMLVRLRGNRSRAEVGRELGVSRQTIYRWERGLRTPTLLVAQQVAQYFGRPVEEVWADEPNPERR